MRSLSVALLLLGGLLMLFAAMDLFQTGGAAAVVIGGALFVSGSVFAAAVSVRDALLQR